MANWWDDLPDDERERMGLPPRDQPAVPPPTEKPGAAAQRRSASGLEETAKETGKYALTRVGKGVTALAGMPADLYNLFIKQGELKPGTPEYERFVKYHGYKPKSVPSVPDWATSDWMNKQLFSVLPERNLEGRIGKIGNIDVGKIIDEAFEAAVGGGPFKAGRTATGVVSNIVGGGTGALAGEATKGTKYELPARMLGGAGGSMAASIPSVVRTKPGSLLARATKDMTEADWDAAAKRFKESGGLLTGPEALIDSPNSPLAQLYGDVMASGRGGQITKRAETRMPLLDAEFERKMQLLAPGAKPDLRGVETELGKSATAATDRPWAFRSDQARPSYDAAKVQPMSPRVELNAYVRIMRERDQARPGSPQWHVANDLLERFRTVRNTDDMLQVLSETEGIVKLRAPDDTKMQGELRTRFKPQLQRLHDEMLRTNPDLMRGEGFYRRYGTRDARTGEPLPSSYSESVTAARQSPTGDIADVARTAKPGSGDVMRTFTSKAIDPQQGATPSSIRDTIGRLNAEDWRAQNPTPADIRRGVVAAPQDPQSAAKAFRLYMENEYNAAGKGPRADTRNVQQGPAFRQRVAGTADDRANVHAWVEGLTGNATAAEGFNKMLDIMRRQGLIPGVGSPTAGRSQRFAEARNSGLITTLAETAPGIGAGVTAGNWGAVGRGVLDKWKDFKFGRVYSKLADLAVDPDSVKQLQRLALMEAGGPKAQALARALWQSVLAVEDMPDQPQ